MNILLIEPYYGGSHKVWCDGFAAHSQHSVELLTLPAQFWKWRMQGGAVTSSRLFQEGDFMPDLIVASDMLDVSTFRAMTRTNIPIALYFHENQLTYPQNARQKHGWQYGFINYVSALASDAIFFNSRFHMDAFFDELPRMLKHFADYNELQTIGQLQAKASVLPLGLDLRRYDDFQQKHSTNTEYEAPLILWNHRWEADKNPSEFFEALDGLMSIDVPFRVGLAGENFQQSPDEFEAARVRLGERIVHYGYAASFEEYARLLCQSDYVVSTAYQDFFGIAVAEAIYCGCIPILARRLNYPDLILERYHDACLYPEGKLMRLLELHLTKQLSVDVAALQKNIAQYDWTMLIDTYDRTFEALVERL